MMADNVIRQPRKGILKNSSSFETVERQKELSKETKWDEMNIIATLHPKDKDYGHMKIDEPKTPYSYETVDELDCVDAKQLAEKIKLRESELPKAMNELSSDSDPDETEEEKKKRKHFEMKRKHHYNEYQAVKLARKLMEQDEDEDDSPEEVDSAQQPDENRNSESL